MSYLGRGLEQVDNISKLDNITFNGGTTYALTKDSIAFTPISSNALLVSIDGVVQQGNFSVSGTNIVFNFSPTGSNTCDFIMHYGTGIAFTPADSSITKDKTDFISTFGALWFLTHQIQQLSIRLILLLSIQFIFIPRFSILLKNVICFFEN